MNRPLDPSGKCLILNVNDAEGARYMTSLILRRAGFRVIEAKTGAEALAQIEAHYPDLVVLDVKLPDMTGFEVCRLVRENPPPSAVKILHTSATYVALENKIQSLENGADGYLMQPFEPEELVATIRSLLRLNSAETALRDHAERLQEADRRKDEFLGMLAHELRNPLAAIVSSLPLIERRPSMDALEQRAREVLHRQAAHLTHLVDDLLDTARVTQGKIHLQREVVDLRDIIKRVAEVAESTRVAPRAQKLTTSLPPRPLMVDGDHTRLEQIFINLIDNASKYTPRGGLIQFEASADDDGLVRVRVRDNGKGILPEALPSIFNLFEQSEVQLARSLGGLGIGLTLVRSLAELHGGTVLARSEGIGHGSEFEVSLPLVRSSSVPEPLPAEPRARPTTTRKLVLLVEDNPDLQEMFRGALEMLGHCVICADDGLTAVRMAIDEAPDVAFVDIGLPGIDGYEVARRIRKSEKGGDIRLFALSGYGSPEQKEMATEAGFEQHLVKPVAVDRIAAVLNECERACA